MTKRFFLKPEHIKLLENAYIGWDNLEFGAPTIDCKRPYGNSDVIGDILEILRIPAVTSDDGEYTQHEYDLAKNLHKETQIALQIILRTKSFVPGWYVTKSNYGIDWEPE